ncbi:hypothetical protein JHK82_033964 [Glycine max]|uniref:Uncharacterized protein n=2 Tax=Glycine subgen. Soja TaxID=1462606 RepID=A0A0R0H5P4_SOYBN|nr:hypothetical protein JHK85_034671 [Glycine max]RZB76006.1 hypothetical protein D0Y65_034490 [Glycine soja]KAG4986347.1 hypothetical protein JHK86_034038 [Glycine max]KAG5119544.1 hypothetical protein JHK82_033964 [Glycine max]KAG5140531.1 hypothetical protein JHK84_034299 [Glycine max]
MTTVNNQSPPFDLLTPQLLFTSLQFRLYRYNKDAVGATTKAVEWQHGIGIPSCSKKQCQIHHHRKSTPNFPRFEIPRRERSKLLSL